MRHVGEKMRLKIGGFSVGFSRSFSVINPKMLRLTKEQYLRFQSGGKVMMPRNLLNEMFERNLINSENPVQFRIHNTRTSILLMCGIYDDFHERDPGSIFLPDWMIEYMDIQ